MEFLKAILGEELFNQFMEKIDAFNGNEENKDKQVKLENINSGNYISKLKYDDVAAQLEGKNNELTNANNLISELKKASKGNEDIQAKFIQYEQQNAQLQAELQETKIKSAIKVALMSERAVDVDYLTYKLNEKLKEKGESLELDENENIKGWSDKLSGLKTQFPTMFESVSDNNEGYQVLNPNKLPNGENTGTLTKEQLLKKPYAERARIAQENPEAYAAAMNS